MKYRFDARDVVVRIQICHSQLILFFFFYNLRIKLKKDKLMKTYETKYSILFDYKNKKIKIIYTNN